MQWQTGTYSIHFVVIFLAEKWISMSLCLLQYHTAKSEYEQEILAVYNVVLEKTQTPQITA